MRQAIIRPPALRAGDTIGIAAPASPFDRDQFEQGVAILESMGYRVKIPDNLFARERYLAGPDAQRALQLMRLFEDESVKAILCARGGYGSMRILPLLDFETIRGRPKIVAGYSDNTALLLAINRECGMVTFHGPHVTSLKTDSQTNADSLFETVGSEKGLVLNAGNPLILRPGRASGRLLGGNLTTLCHMVGTPWEPRFKGCLLLLEDRGEAAYRIDRMLCQLNLGGRLDRVAGVILGAFHNCGSMEDVYEVVRQAFDRHNVPVLAGFDLGHGTENLTVPIGLEARLDTEAGSLTFQEAAVTGAGS